MDNANVQPAEKYTINGTNKSQIVKDQYSIIIWQSSLKLYAVHKPLVKHKIMVKLG